MRRSAGTAAQGISLFPFLAVLLCTMGALIVVLVALNRHSRLQAAALSTAEVEARKAAADEAQADAELLRETAAWRLDHLRTSREKTQADLDRERLRLSGVEEHRRQLEAELTKLQRAAAQLNDAETVIADAPATRVAALGSQIESARAQLDEARRRAAEQSPAYSVVAYEGPNRTQRRPIYIECYQDRVVIQPEGVVLLAADFEGPMGPGNPLASAVRAARDHMVAAAPDPKSPEAEPYPLFLVRPDGIEAYYAARAAMQSWGSDFGYQTVDQDWTLAYPPVDTRLAELERQAVDEARDRLQWLAQMNPGRYGGERGSSGGKVSYYVSPMGGLVREGGPTLREGSGGFAGSRGAARRGAGGTAKRGLSNAANSHESSVMTGSNGRREGPAAPAAKTGTRSVSESTDGQGMADHRQSAKETEPRYGDLNERAKPRSERSSSNSVDAQGSAQTAAESGHAEINGKPAPKAKERPRSLADLRGANWGLSPAARASNPITRPIHIVCEGDKLLVRPERPGDPPVAVPLRLRTEDSIDQLVSAVQGRIADWGIAGRGLYWRPQLILTVGHSGEGRYADLEALMADSGFDVKRK